MSTNTDDSESRPGNDRDAGVVEQICGYLTADPPQSFFLFAGAGSGKTRTLIEVLRRLTGLHTGHKQGIEFASRLRMFGQKIGVITYTNNAVDIIRNRLGINALVSVSTIHSFAWDLIRGLDHDIRKQLVTDAQDKLADAKATAGKRKKGPTKKDEETISRLEGKIVEITATRHFTYTPDRLAYGVGALEHHQVLQLASAFLTLKPTMAQVLRDRHPIILIDESQDTMKDMLDALRTATEGPGTPLSLGLIGDHRQRIYTDGHRDLPAIIPPVWARPALRMNHRSAKRIVRLINRIWTVKMPGRTQSASGEEQHARLKREEGSVRLFLGRADTSPDEKIKKEQACADHMALSTGDSGWRAEKGYRTLTLEHMLAARRAGFHGFASALQKADKEAVWERGEAGDGSVVHHNYRIL